mmetsp:Transcript_32673/g.81260  ORF Transcript_32673/g.81260 Transcript_32673/m.81260 type:complete len:205 (-) Transcript_32673:831-1445(-)
MRRVGRTKVVVLAEERAWAAKASGRDCGRQRRLGGEGGGRDGGRARARRAAGVARRDDEHTVVLLRLGGGGGGLLLGPAQRDGRAALARRSLGALRRGGGLRQRAVHLERRERVEHTLAHGLGGIGAQPAKQAVERLAAHWRDGAHGDRAGRACGGRLRGRLGGVVLVEFAVLLAGQQVSELAGKAGRELRRRLLDVPVVRLDE